MVEQNDQGRPVTALGLAFGMRQHIGKARIGKGLCLGHNALVATALGTLVELRAGNHIDLHASGLRLTQNVLHQAIALSVVGQQDAFHRDARAQRLDDRSFTFDVFSHGAVPTFRSMQ